MHPDWNQTCNPLVAHSNQPGCPARTDHGGLDPLALLSISLLDTRYRHSPGLRGAVWEKEKEEVSTFGDCPPSRGSLEQSVPT